MARSTLFRQVGLLVLVSMLCTGIQLFRRGTNIVTDTYALAAERLKYGESPYQPSVPGTDQYKYSLWFAELYRPFAALDGPWQAVAWALCNALFFWWGLSLWSPLGRGSPRAIWIGFLLASMELDGSLRYQQVNALLTGLMLLGASWYQQGRWVASGTLLALATNFKILPGLLAGALCFSPAVRLRNRFLGAFALSFILFLLLPAFLEGAKFTAIQTLNWVQLLFSDTQGGGLYDIASVGANMGLPKVGKVVKWAVAIGTLVALVWLRRRGDRLTRVLSITLLCLLLVNPRTESPTFVLLSPVYVFLAEELLPLRSRALWVIYTLAAIVITVSFNDVWPQKILRIGWTSYNRKTVGALLLWSMGLWIYFVRPTLTRSRRA